QQQAPPTAGGGGTSRKPTQSPFRFPVIPDDVRTAPSSTISDIQVETSHRKTKRNRRQKKVPIPPKRMDRLDEDMRETSHTHKSSKVTSALIHRGDDQSSTSDVTEV
ncbi:unnamed protein product, partial [Rotaria socialis]